MPRRSLQTPLTTSPAANCPQSAPHARRRFVARGVTSGDWHRLPPVWSAVGLAALGFTLWLSAASQRAHGAQAAAPSSAPTPLTQSDPSMLTSLPPHLLQNITAQLDPRSFGSLIFCAQALQTALTSEDPTFHPRRNRWRDPLSSVKIMSYQAFLQQNQPGVISTEQAQQLTPSRTPPLSSKHLSYPSNAVHPSLNELRDLVDFVTTPVSQDFNCIALTLLRPLPLTAATAALLHCRHSTCGLKLSERELARMLQALSLPQQGRLPHVTALRLGQGTLSDECVHLLMDLVLPPTTAIPPQKPQPPRLRELDLRGSAIISAEALRPLAWALLQPGNSLEKFSVDQNSDDDAAVCKFAAALIHPHCKLKSLRYGRSGMTPWGAQALACSLIQQSATTANCACSLAELHFTCSFAQETATLSAILMVQALAQNYRLRALTLRIAPLGRAGAAILAVALRGTHLRLDSLDLGFCALGDDGAILLACGLQAGHTQLTHMDLEFNNITFCGALAINRALAQSTSTKSGCCSLKT